MCSTNQNCMIRKAINRKTPLMLPSLTIWTNTTYYMFCRDLHVADRQFHLRNWASIEASRTMATLTIEMYVPVIILITTMRQAQLITNRLSTLYRMHKMLLPEQRQRTRDTRFVYRQNLVFQLCQRHRTVRF